MNIHDIQLHAGVHTLYVVGESRESNIKVRGISKEHAYIDKETGETKIGMRINPNKYLLGVDGYIDSLTTLTETIFKMLEERQLYNYAIQRIDFRVDNYDDEFIKLYKLNNILINILANCLQIENVYKSAKNDISHNIIAKDTFKEIECYNRIVKDGGGLAKTRLEFRSKFLNRNLLSVQNIDCVCKEWIELLENKMISLHYIKYQRFLNEEIVKEWESGKSNFTSRNFIGLLANNINFICTSQQMRNLCGMLNLAKDVPYTYKSRLHIDYYSNADILSYISKIVDALNIFLAS